MDLWTCGSWVADRISIMYVAGSVDRSIRSRRVFTFSKKD